MLIRDFLSPGFDAYLITYPRRWCKSMNLSMIKYFLTIEVDKNGNRIPKEKRKNTKLFTGGEINLKDYEDKLDEIKILNPLMISKD